MLYIFGGDEHNWYTNRKCVGDYQKKLCLSNNERVGTIFYIKMNLTGFPSALYVNKLLGNLHLAGLGYLYCCLLSSLGNKNFARFTGWYELFAKWVLNNWHMQKIILKRRTGNTWMKYKAEQISCKEYSCINCCIQDNGTIYIWLILWMI